jgi:hypothetical protein
MATKQKKRLYEEKMKTHIGDLRRNEAFSKLLDKLDIAQTEDDKKSLFDELAEKYGVDIELWENTHLLRGQHENIEVIAGEIIPSMCTLTDQYNLNFHPLFVSDYYRDNLRMRTHIKAYPVSIDVHRFASKEDIIDFVDDNWKAIESQLRNDSEKRLDVRDRPCEDRDRFIYKHREKKPEEIRALIKDRYPEDKVWLGRDEIKSIVRAQQKARKQDLSGGR